MNTIIRAFAFVGLLWAIWKIIQDAQAQGARRVLQAQEAERKKQAQISAIRAELYGRPRFLIEAPRLSPTEEAELIVEMAIEDAEDEMTWEHARQIFVARQLEVAR